MVEKYYAIRVGDPRRHYPYLWCDEDGRTPRLFFTRKEADEEAVQGGWGKDSSVRVVAVRVNFSPNNTPVGP